MTEVQDVRSDKNVPGRRRVKLKNRLRWRFEEEVPWSARSIEAGLVMLDALREYPAYSGDAGSRKHFEDQINVVDNGLLHIKELRGKHARSFDYVKFIQTIRDLSRIIYHLPEKSEERGSVRWLRAVRKRLSRRSRFELSSIIMRNDRNADVRDATKSEMLQIIMELVQEENTTPDEWFRQSNRDPRRRRRARR